MRRGVGLLLLLFLLAGTVAGSAEPLAVVRVPARAEVFGPHIYLGDIADIDTDDANLAQRLHELALGRAAIPGQSRELNIGTVRVRMRQRSLPEKQITIDAAQRAVSVVTRAQVVSGAALAEAAEAAVHRHESTSEGAVEPTPAEVVLACAEPDAVSVADGMLELHVARLIGTAPGPIVVSVDIIVGDT